MNSFKIFKNKKVLITGHTGFKGSWLTIWLIELGAKVYGISNDIPTKPSHFESSELSDKTSNLTIENTNVFDISGKDLKISIFYNKFNLGTGNCNENFKLDSKSISPIKIDFKLYLDSIPDKLRMKLFEMDSIPLKMQLSFKGSLGIKHKQDG